MQSPISVVIVDAVSQKMEDHDSLSALCARLNTNEIRSAAITGSFDTQVFDLEEGVVVSLGALRQRPKKRMSSSRVLLARDSLWGDEYHLSTEAQ
ncbi:hypothetical protein HO173_006237 [Letharia columbiana]|uniref:Uncharacterized protein n=1 Tax=Letharia columbiana TaxID=112416 RepID=A0A8H6FVK2_9LECA|nr:uncharacterized protein HO173_006237 [Letharia columbiana]KAF6235554.1 hypothetical protein HO173_006237 [Letharia columbiana]